MLHENFDKIHAMDQKFDFGISILRLTDFEYVKFDPKKLQINARRMDMTTGEKISYKRTNLPLSQCDPSVNFPDIPQ